MTLPKVMCNTAGYTTCSGLTLNDLGYNAVFYTSLRGSRNSRASVMPEKCSEMQRKTVSSLIYEGTKRAFL